MATPALFSLLFAWNIFFQPFAKRYLAGRICKSIQPPFAFLLERLVHLHSKPFLMNTDLLLFSCSLAVFIVLCFLPLSSSSLVLFRFPFLFLLCIRFAGFQCPRGLRISSCIHSSLFLADGHVFENLLSGLHFCALLRALSPTSCFG